MPIWLKAVGVMLLFYGIIAGLLGRVPEREILYESIRNLYFHVPMWFGMFFLFFVSFILSLMHLSKNRERLDLMSKELIKTGVVFGLLGIFTGALWARYTWGEWWSNDIKQNGAAITLLVYMAYGLLRNSIENQEVKARMAAIYNIFAFFALIPLIFILPRLTDSLHPGSGGNPAFNAYDLDDRMRMVFYPAVIGWIIIGLWMSEVHMRISFLKQKLLNEDE